MPPKPKHVAASVTPVNAYISSVCPLPTGPKAAEIPGTCARHPSADSIGSAVLTGLVITLKGADHDVADPCTGTDKGNPTVTAISAIPADSESEGSTKNSHLVGCRHSC